ncbi:hypothetical protein IFM89_022014 [Coptis chinensis]|uniref:FAE domain-containing protein n=1 Tax=Coptis chinensis TaxID=261450 RepID=A0A835M131_9MAGN|nr:hypothetical protein IFM89_022014 [Coptis chinensis]
MAGEQALLSTEIVNRGIESSGPDAGYHYLINHAIYLATIPVLVLVLVLVLVFSAEVGSISREGLWNKIWEDTARYDLATLFAFFGVLVFTLSVYFMSRPRPIYLIDFVCYRPDDELKVSKEDFIELARKSGKFDEASLEFQNRILEASDIGDETYIPQAIWSPENCSTMKEGRAEASTIIFGTLDELFEKCRIRPKDVGVLVVNCSLFNPTPSLSAMIVNHYKMRGNILSFNLGGMGCSVGIIAIDLARDMLQANPNNYAVVVSTEMVTFNFVPRHKPFNAYTKLLLPHGMLCCTSLKPKTRFPTG